MRAKIVRGIDVYWHNILLIFEGIAVGTIVFWMMYGFSPLNVTNDKWIMSGYDESDIIQHYAGWCAYRISSWHFPIGFADTMGGGTYISYTDSIPWFAVLFKFVLQIIHYNGTFQYFGIYAFLCYIFQAIAAGVLISRRTSNHFVICISMLLLCFSPIFMEKSLRHTALGSQWLLLFAMYAYLKFRDLQFKKFPLMFGVLAVIAIGVHPYFLPLVLVFSLLSLLSSIYSKTNILKNSIGFSISILLPIVAGLILGVLGTGVDVSRSGYGYWTLNLNAVFNPVSRGGYVWSNFLKVHPQTLGNLNENTYLGLGYLILIFSAMISFFIAPPKWNRNKILDVLTYIFISICMTAFAVTNVVAFNDKILVKIPIPYAILNLCGIFRASPRMFYFTYYSLVIFSLYRIFDVIKDVNLTANKNKVLPVSKIMTAYFIIFIFCFVQFIDVCQAVWQKHSAMTEKVHFKSILDDDVLADAVSGKHYLISNTGDVGLNRSLAVFAGKNKLTTSFSIANSGDYSSEAAKASKIINDFVFGIHSDNLIVVYKDLAAAKELYKLKRISSSCKYIESNGLAFIIADNNTEDHVRYPNEFIASSLTDANWSKGILKSGNTILFVYSEDMLNKLNNGFTHVSDDKGNTATIIKFESVGTKWIRVTLDRNAKNYAYPHITNFNI